MRYAGLALFAAASSLSLAAIEKAAYDSHGRIIALLSDAEDIPVSTNVVAVIPGGRRIPLQVRINRVGARRQGDRLAWTQEFTLAAASGVAIGHPRQLSAAVRFR